MNNYYLIPQLDKMSQREIYLIGFYLDHILVSDGLLWWKYFNNNLPLLSYLDIKGQVESIAEVAELNPSHKDALVAYKELVDSGIIEHSWLAEKSWEITLKKNDTSIDYEIFPLCQHTCRL